MATALLAWPGVGFCRPSSVEGEAAEASKRAEQLVKNWVAIGHLRVDRLVA